MLLLTSDISHVQLSQKRHVCTSARGLGWSSTGCPAASAPAQHQTRDKSLSEHHIVDVGQQKKTTSWPACTCLLQASSTQHQPVLQGKANQRCTQEGMLSSNNKISAIVHVPSATVSKMLYWGNRSSMCQTQPVAKVRLPAGVEQALGQGSS